MDDESWGVFFKRRATTTLTPHKHTLQALTGVIKRSKATTMMGLERELKDAAATLERCNPTALSLKAGCELFLRFATRTSALELADFAAAKAHIVDVSVWTCFFWVDGGRLLFDLINPPTHPKQHSAASTLPKPRPGPAPPLPT